MPISDQRLDDFLTRYAGSTATDPALTGSLWGLPGMLLGDDSAGALDTREQMEEGLAASAPLYRRLGLASVDYTLLERVDLTERIVRLRIRWHFLDEDGGKLTDGDYEYVLRDDDGELHAYFAIAIDEAEKLAALAREKGVDLGGPAEA